MFGDTGEDGDDLDDVFGDMFSGMGPGADFGPGMGGFDEFE